MKIKGAKQVHYDSGPNMTPLVDVVMVILIFLMLAGSFGTAEHFLTSNLPVRTQGAGSVELKPGHVDPVLFEVRLDPDPSGFKVVAEDVYVVGSAAGLKQAFERKIAAYALADTPASEIEVVLFPGPMVQYQAVAQVYEAVLAAEQDGQKFTKVALKSSGL